MFLGCSRGCDLEDLVMKFRVTCVAIVEAEDSDSAESIVEESIGRANCELDEIESEEEF